MENLTKSTMSSEISIVNSVIVGAEVGAQSTTLRFLVRTQFRAIIPKRWDYCHTDAMGFAFLLDPNTDTSMFVESNESKPFKEAVKFGEWAKVLSVWVSRASSLRLSFDFATKKKRWTDEQRAENAGIQQRVARQEQRKGSVQQALTSC